MATLTETTVRVLLHARREEDGAHVIVEADSLAADGTVIRHLTRDITDQLGAARLAGVADLLTDAETRLRTLWEIT